uniref:Gem-associated protein 8 n=1 Tax=Amblyomma maculatum TaxID=34609 RepID=G3MQ65_AMBMU
MRPISNPNTDSASYLRGRWYQNPLFKRYWRHYNSTLQWFQQHQQLMRDVTGRSVAAPSETSVTYAEQDDSSFEMPVTEELITFFEQSARHRKSLCSSGAEQEEELQEQQQQSWRRQASSSPGALHHRRLYGAADGAMVHGMELAMQLTFEHFVDSNQAKHWPNIALKL